MSCRGSGASAAWDALEAGASAGLEWSPGDGDPRFCAPVPDDYRPHSGIPRNLAHFLDRGALIALDAALQAIEHAGLGAGAGDARRFAVADGLPYRAPGQPAVFVPYGHLVARALGVRGPVVSAAGHEASGLAALASAVRLLERGDADVVIAGAAQGLQQPLLDHLFEQGFAARAAARPFDAAHAGFVAAEGAAVLVLEREEHALDRGAEPLAHVAGIADRFDSAVEPLELSGAPEAGRVMQDALAAAGYVQNQVDLVISCADGRPAADFAEGYGLQRTFGRHAYFAGVTTVAGALGFSLAASGLVSVVAALEAMRRQRSFPIAGFETPEHDVELNYVREAKAERLDTVLVTSLGLGGTNVSVLLERLRGR